MTGERLLCCQENTNRLLVLLQDCNRPTQQATEHGADVLIVSAWNYHCVPTLLTLARPKCRFTNCQKIKFENISKPKNKSKTNKQKRTWSRPQGTSTNL